jgi:phage-related minor tail protein
MATVLGIEIKIGFDEKSIKAANKKMGKLLKTGLKAGGIAAAGALGAVGAAALVATSEAINFAEESNAAMEQFRRQTGLSQESVEDFSKSTKNLFAQGVGEGIDDIAGAMATVRKTMQSGAKETEGLTKRALAMRDVFDKDVGGSIDAVKVLMDEFGLTSDQAFDFLAEGITKGLDRNDDLLDSVREYGGLFSQGGADAGHFFSVLESGAAGGVLGTDKAADAFKEFQIRFVEGNEDLAEGLGTLGLDYEILRKSVNDGSLSMTGAFGLVTRTIGRVDQSILSNQEAVAKLGTQFEDLGIEAAGNISIGVTSLDDMAGSMDQVIAKNQIIGESMDILKRRIVVALEPAAQELMPLFAAGVAKISEFFTAAQPIFVAFSQELGEKLGPALQIVGESLQRIGVVLGIVTEDADGMDASLQALETTLNLIVTAIEAVAVAAKLMADAFEIAKGLADQVATISNLAGEAIGGEAGEGLFGRQGALNVFGLQGGGIIPGGPNDAVPIIAHGGEEFANPNEGQAITINGETFAVRAASQMAAAINSLMERNAQMIVDTVAANL